MSNEHWPDAPTPEQIRDARKAARLTQEQAGALLYRSARAWQNWEYDINDMDPALWEHWNAKVGQLETASPAASSARIAMDQFAQANGTTLKRFFSETGISEILADALIEHCEKGLTAIDVSCSEHAGVYLSGALCAANLIGARLILDRTLDEMDLEMVEQDADAAAVLLAASEDDDA